MWVSDKTGNYKKYISEEEEIRDWFKVSKNRKKVRNIQLWLFEELKKICDKHKIKYYADWWTLLWAIRHKWFIPRDDDLDIGMFREDYERFSEIAKKELPNYVELRETYWWLSKLINRNTTCLRSNENRNNKELVGGINIDLFPIDYASKFKIINIIKSRILYNIKCIIQLKDMWWTSSKVRWWKKNIIPLCKTVFGKISPNTLINFNHRINKINIKKWKKVYTPYITNRFFPDSIFATSHNVKFETTTICVPDWYDEWLRIAYWDYMKPIIFPWWHNCRFSVDKSYKDIIRTFDKSKSNEENYNSCKDLFTLD